MFISPLRRALLLGLVVTCLAAAVSHVSPAEHAASLVALVFAGATYWLVLRKDAKTIQDSGLALGGLFSPEPLSVRRIARDTGSALLWTVATCALIFPPFWLGYTLWFGVDDGFSLKLRDGFWDEALGHLLVIALPEEMFYRGYLQSAIDDASTPRVKLLGARVGWGLVVASAIFALGHLLATPLVTRLAVFFPALLFGWLRVKTGGIGAAVLVHACCNIFASILAQGYE